MRNILLIFPCRLRVIFNQFSVHAEKKHAQCYIGFLQVSLRLKIAQLDVKQLWQLAEIKKIYIVVCTKLCGFQGANYIVYINKGILVYLNEKVVPISYRDTVSAIRLGSATLGIWEADPPG